ncbi:unnamed protein product [Paramecium octaurelia]|uniref:Uncharacterized protein n=1 Tax=Paramecium octaurelia TaxID=43137 RepID=A0A8S1YAV2_PAROT|nr:unnamed protein product [Paramecium octaurelia]
MRTNQGSNNDLLNRNNQARRDIDQLISTSPNGWKDPTVQNTQGYVSREKYNKLKDLNSKLKSTLKEYIQDTKDKERLLQMKEEQLIKYEKERVDSQSKGNEELKTQLNDLKIKLLLKEQSKTIDSRFVDKKSNYQVELDRVQRMYDSQQNEIKEQEKRYLILKDENNILKQALQSKEDQIRYYEMGAQEDRQHLQLLESKIKELQEEKKILQIAIDNQTSKIDETEKFIKLNDSRHQQEIIKIESEKQQLQNEYLSQITQKKDKGKSLQHQIQLLEQQLAQQKKEELQFNKIIQEQKQDYLKLQSQLEDQKYKTDQALKETNFKVQEAKELKQKFESQKSIVQTYEDKLAQYDIQYQLDQNEKQQMLFDIDQIDQENKKLQHLLYESDKDISYLKQQHEDDLLQIERKIESLIRQLNESKEEIQEQKKLIQELKKQVISSDEQANAFKNKYLKVKQNQKTLQSEQKYLEEKVKLMENERIFEEKEALKTKDYAIQQRSVQQSKVRHDQTTQKNYKLMNLIQYTDLKIKLQKKKTKIRLLKEQSKTIDSRFVDKKSNYQVELDRVQRMYDSQQNEIKEQEKRYLILKDENNILKQALQSKEDQIRYYEMGAQEDRQHLQLLESKIKELQEEKKILQIAIDNQTSKIDETEKFIKLNDSRHQQEIIKIESEKQQLQNEYLSQITQKKDKGKSLQHQIQLLEQQLAQQKKEELQFNKIIQEQKQDYLKLQSQLEDQKYKTDQALKETNFKVQEAKELKQKFESQKSIVQTYEDKLAQYDIQYQLDQNEKQQMLFDIDQIDQENKKLQHLLYESDKDISYLKQQHEDDLLQIERKIESLIRQLNESKEEIQEQKKLIQELKKQVISSDEQANAFKNKYLKVKQNQKTLQSEQKYLEEKVKLMENERIFEEKEALKTKDYAIQQRSVQQSKVRVLDEIQSMIKQHKKITS